MAPKRGQSIEPSDERDEFMQKLAEYHDKRGTRLDPEPKVGVRRVDLRKLYDRVVDEGGYDLCSDTKAKPLTWRKMAEEFVGKNPYTAAQAFQIKNVYYKNLVAYEITHHWKQEPPPKEILEFVTAKGGNVMTRTLDNFARPAPRDPDSLQNGDDSEEESEHQTPKEEKSETLDEPGSVGRSTRGLRQQPPQRVLFQPDVSSSRRGHLQAAQTPSTPTPHVNGLPHALALSNGASSTLACYEPSQPLPLSLRPVITPANNPDHYRNERKRKLEASSGPLAKKYKNIMLPGTGFIGPNIYVRAQLALQSGIPEEEEYALHHLVKISHERGDKYRFDQFPGLADALAKKVLQVTRLFYNIDLDVEYDDYGSSEDPETLNGLHGTPDFIQELKTRPVLIPDDGVLDSHFSSELNRILEAGLVLRNMSLQEENAAYLSRLPLVRDLVAIVLHLPPDPSTVELQHYILEMAEQMVKYLNLAPSDSMYQGLLLQSLSDDRGAIAIALRSVARVAMAHPTPKKLENVPDAVLRRAHDYLFVEDEELRCACLDFFMQYTSFSDNVDYLVHFLDAGLLAQHLARLLLFAAKEHKENRAPLQKEPTNAHLPSPRLCKRIVDDLLKLDEPERSSEWLRMCFFPDDDAEMTQISLWQAYQATFAAYHSTHPHLIAGDFIKNVSSTFHGATAQVAGSNKYVIKGIRPREIPIDTGILAGSKASDKGKELVSCHWKITYSVEGNRDPVTGIASAPRIMERECDDWFRNSDEMLHHILTLHLRVPEKRDSPRANQTADNDHMDIDPDAKTNDTTKSDALPNGTSSSHGRSFAACFDFASADKTTHRCRWSDCKRMSSELSGSHIPRTLLFARHIATHLPESLASKTKANLKHGSFKSAMTRFGEVTRLGTLEDEKGDAAGIPLGAALVLRNIARFMPQGSGKSNSLRSTHRASQARSESLDFMNSVFDGVVREHMFYAMSHNKTIRDYVARIFTAIRQGGG